MAKKSKTSSPSSSTTAASSTEDRATAADLALAAQCLPSNRKTPIRTMSTKFVDTYAAIPLQQGLAALAVPLASFDGCGGVQSMLDLATEGRALAASHPRLQAAADSVGQRVIEINQQLQSFDTSLNRAATTAAAGTPVKKGLSTLAKQRAVANTRKKSSRTKNKNKKKKSASKA